MAKYLPTTKALPFLIWCNELPVSSEIENVPVSIIELKLQRWASLNLNCSFQKNDKNSFVFLVGSLWYNQWWVTYSHRQFRLLSPSRCKCSSLKFPHLRPCRNPNLKIGRTSPLLSALYEALASLLGQSTVLPNSKHPSPWTRMVLKIERVRSMHDNCFD